MKNYKSAFTMIELIFVIIIIGILSSIAVSKFGSMSITANIANAKADIAAIRSAIITERQRSLVRGEPSYMSKLSPSTLSTTLFTGDGGVGGEPARILLTYGFKAGTGSGEWQILSDTQYEFNSGEDTTIFTYNEDDGKFDCTQENDNDCDKLAN